MENEKSIPFAEKPAQQLKWSLLKLFQNKALDPWRLRGIVRHLLDLRAQFLHRSQRAQSPRADKHLHHPQHRRDPGVDCRRHRFLSRGRGRIFGNRRGRVCRDGNTHLDIDDFGCQSGRNDRLREWVPGCQDAFAVLSNHLRNGDPHLRYLGGILCFRGFPPRAIPRACQLGQSGQYPRF